MQPRFLCLSDHCSSTKLCDQEHRPHPFQSVLFSFERCHNYDHRGQYPMSQQPRDQALVESALSCHFLLKKGLSFLRVSISWSLLRSTPSNPPLSSLIFPHHGTVALQADFVGFTCFCPYMQLEVFKCSLSPSFPEDITCSHFPTTLLVVLFAFLKEKKVDSGLNCYQVDAGTRSS